MIRKEFPDLQWLKKQIAQQFNNKQGWPNVVLHTRAQQTYRPDIKGTLSLFLNIQGQSRCGVNNQLVNIDDSTFFISNQHQHYTLEVDNTATETFNIHFSDTLLSEVYAGLVIPSNQLLDRLENNEHQIDFYNRLYRKDAAFIGLIYKIYQYSLNEWNSPMLLEEQLTDVLIYLLTLHAHVQKEVNRLPAIKKSTQAEIYKRLCYSLDYIHSYYTQELNLDELAGIACLSKYHYLRLFKSVFRQSPYQYMLQLRLEKAQQLLKATQMPITAISVVLGFQNITSFSRLFHQRYQYSPLQYRLVNSSDKLAILVN